MPRVSNSYIEKINNAIKSGNLSGNELVHPYKELVRMMLMDEEVNETGMLLMYEITTNHVRSDDINGSLLNEFVNKSCNSTVVKFLMRNTEFMLEYLQICDWFGYYYVNDGYMISNGCYVNMGCKLPDTTGINDLIDTWEYLGFTVMCWKYHMYSKELVQADIREEKEILDQHRFPDE